MTSFAEVMFENSFYPHINLPTRITGTSATCIDHIWSNILDRDVVCGIISETIADHMITFQCSDFNLTEPKDPSHDLKPTKIDYEKLSTALRDVDTKDIMTCNDLDAAYSKLEDCVSKCIQACRERFTP